MWPVKWVSVKQQNAWTEKGYITYLKEAEKITEFLNVIGAHNSLLRFEDVRIVRDMRNSVNRLVNCETANLNKTIGASLRQVENIKYIDERIGLEALPEKLREIAQLRIDYQEVTLKEPGGNGSKRENQQIRDQSQAEKTWRNRRTAADRANRHFKITVKKRGDLMVQQKVEVRLKTGLQARPAALFVQEANRFTSDVFLEKDGKK